MDNKDLTSKLEEFLGDDKKIQDIKNVGKNGRKVLTERFIKLEQDLIAKAKPDYLSEAKFELSQIYKNIDDALDYKLEKIIKDWEKMDHDMRFLNFDKPDEEE